MKGMSRAVTFEIEGSGFAPEGEDELDAVARAGWT